METLILSSRALEQLGRLLRERPVVECPVLFGEVLNQRPELLLQEDPNNQIGEQVCLF